MKKSIKLLHWIPRIISIIAILFISIFALDSFGPNMSIWEQMGSFLIHFIPTFILLILLIVAWKWEYIGGIIFIIIGLGLSPIIFQHNYNMNKSIVMSLGIIMMITFPFILAGTLFIISHFRKKKESSKNYDQ